MVPDANYTGLKIIPFQGTSQVHSSMKSSRFIVMIEVVAEVFAGRIRQ